MNAISTLYGRACGNATRLLGSDLLLFVARIAIAAVFFLSGRTKVEGILSVSDSTHELFRSEYALPWLDPLIAAHAATYAEHLFPLLLVLGLFTRVSALALLAMTAVIQVFVYPDAWSTHLLWAAILLILVGQGAGQWSLDQVLRVEGSALSRSPTSPPDALPAGRLPRR